MAASPTPPNRPPVGNIADFVIGDISERLDLQVAIKHDGGVVVFHTHPFKHEVSWLEFDLNTSRLNFVLDDGDLRDIGIPLPQTVAKYMHNAHQVLMVLMDIKTGEASEGRYVPIILHRA
jgi:hypothetical protein